MKSTADSKFPFFLSTTTQKNCTPPRPGYYDLHWHEELQFTIVTKGSVSIMVNGTTHELSAHHAIFINSGLLHSIHPISEDSEYMNITFSEKLLSILPGESLEADFVHRFTRTSPIPAIPMMGENAWQNTVISMLLDLCSFYIEGDVYAKNYEIALRLQAIWLFFIRNVKENETVTSHAFLKKQQSVQTMLHFIHEHYKEELSLATIYQTVHVSQAECCRLFKQFLTISPYEYLIQYRMNKAMDLLTETALPISEISVRVGFHDCSHFIQQFKRFTKQTPKAYRNNQIELQ